MQRWLRSDQERRQKDVDVRRLRVARDHERAAKAVSQVVQLIAELEREAERLEPRSSWRFNEKGGKLGLHPMAYLLRKAASELTSLWNEKRDHR